MSVGIHQQDVGIGIILLKVPQCIAQFVFKSGLRSRQKLLQIAHQRPVSAQCAGIAQPFRPPVCNFIGLQQCNGGQLVFHIVPDRCLLRTVILNTAGQHGQDHERHADQRRRQVAQYGLCRSVGQVASGQTAGDGDDGGAAEECQHHANGHRRFSSHFPVPGAGIDIHSHDRQYGIIPRIDDRHQCRNPLTPLICNRADDLRRSAVEYADVACRDIAVDFAGRRIIRRTGGLAVDEEKNRAVRFAAHQIDEPALRGGCPDGGKLGFEPYIRWAVQVVLCSRQIPYAVNIYRLHDNARLLEKVVPHLPVGTQYRLPAENQYQDQQQ